MEQFDRENSSSYVNEPRQTVPEPIVVQPASKKPKKSRTKLILTVLLIMAILAAAFLAWLWQQETANAQNVREEAKAAKQETAALKIQISDAKASAASQAKLDESDDAESDKTKTDSEAITDTLTAYAHAQTRSASSKVTVSIRKLQAPFASATYGDGSSFGGGTGICFLKKADDTWMVLYCAQGDSEYTLKLDEMFGVPATLKQ